MYVGLKRSFYCVITSSEQGISEYFDRSNLFLFMMINISSVGNNINTVYNNRFQNLYFALNYFVYLLQMFKKLYSLYSFIIISTNKVPTFYISGEM